MAKIARHATTGSPSGGSGWDEWIAGLDEATRSRAESLREIFVLLGARQPEVWARSEIDDDIAQLGRFSVLRAVWREIEQWRGIEALPGLAEVPSGETIAWAARVATRAAFETALSILRLIDHETDAESTGETPRWRLVECDAMGEPTGRALANLHESILETDPRGIEAEDIRRA